MIRKPIRTARPPTRQEVMNSILHIRHLTSVAKTINQPNTTTVDNFAWRDKYIALAFIWEKSVCSVSSFFSDCE
jgi:hypothetical protein